MNRQRMRLGIGAAVTVAALSVASPAVAQAQESYEDAIQLSWDGSQFAATTSERFVTAPVTVPGDVAERTLTVMNDGPTDGILTAWIDNVVLLDPDSADIHHNPDHTAPDGSGDYRGAGDQGDFYDDLQISWATGAASATELAAAGTTEILEMSLERGEQVPLSIRVELPYTATSGNTANVDPRLVTFDVHLQLGGDWPASPPAAEPGPLPRTGAELPWAAVWAVLALLGAGAVLTLRRKDVTR